MIGAEFPKRTGKINLGSTVTQYLLGTNMTMIMTTVSQPLKTKGSQHDNRIMLVP